MALEKIINSLKNTGKMLGKASAKAGLCALLHFGMPTSDAKSADIYVTNDYPTIQQAIDASGSNDTIHVQAGKYHENLTIDNKFLNLVGSGTNDCTIYSTINTQPLINIIGPAGVRVSNLHINGGTNWISGNNYWGGTAKGIVATNANLTLNNLILNQFFNYVVTAIDSTLDANDINMFTQTYYTDVCDIGFSVKGAKARINNLKQERGWIDHTIDINNNADSSHSDVIVENSTIRANTRYYGDCIRTLCNSDLIVSNCYLYRIPGGQPIRVPTHTGVGVMGSSNNVVIVDNVIDGVPQGIFCDGRDGIPPSGNQGNKIIIERNEIKNCETNGVWINDLDYAGVDIGGGPFGSRGENTFSHTNPPSYYTDVKFVKQQTDSTANIFALNNTWTGGTANKESYIYDKLDNPILGRLITDTFEMKSPSIDGNGKHVLKWNEQGAGGKYYVYENDNLMNPTNWALVSPTNQWPKTNSSLTADNIWTNTYDSGTNNVKFYKINSIVP